MIFYDKTSATFLEIISCFLVGVWQLLPPTKILLFSQQRCFVTAVFSPIPVCYPLRRCRSKYIAICVRTPTHRKRWQQQHK